MFNNFRRSSLYLKLRHAYKSKEEKSQLAARVKMYKQFCKKNDLVFDVGANVGNRVLAFLQIGCEVVAVEPLPFCRKVLAARFANRIKVVEKGLGEKEETKTMYVSSAASQISSFSEEWIASMKKERFSDQEWDKQEQIEITTVQKLIERFGMPSFIKIDVEGFELNVLKGLSSTVPALSFEYAVPEELARVQACIIRLNEISAGKYRYNYSVGESMLLASEHYYDFQDFSNVITSEAFLKSDFGDVYVKM